MDTAFRSWQDGDIDRDTYADYQHTLVSWSDHQQQRMERIGAEALSELAVDSATAPMILAQLFTQALQGDEASREILRDIGDEIKAFASNPAVHISESNQAQLAEADALEQAGHRDEADVLRMRVALENETMLLGAGGLAASLPRIAGGVVKRAGREVSGGGSTDTVEGSGVVPNNQIGATFEGGLYRSVPEGRNPLEIHPIFNTEKAIHRYTGEGQGGLYLGSSQRIVNSEFTGNGASIEGLVNNHYNVKIDGLLDLTNPSVRSELGVSLDDLVRTGGSKEWRYEITNPLGRYAEDSGYNGIIAPAAQADGGVNVILFNPSLVK